MDENEQMAAWGEEVRNLVANHPYADQINELIARPDLAFLSATTEPIAQPNSFGTIMYILGEGNYERPPHITISSMFSFLKDRCEECPDGELGDIVAFYSSQIKAGGLLRHCGIYLGKLQNGDDMMFHLTQAPEQEFIAIEIEKFLEASSALKSYNFYKLKSKK